MACRMNSAGHNLFLNNQKLWTTTSSPVRQEQQEQQVRPEQSWRKTSEPEQEPVQLPEPVRVPVLLLSSCSQR